MNLNQEIAVIICTHHRIEDARINQELIRYHWSHVPSLANTVIVHSYNGKREWYEKTYLEDDLIRSSNSNLSQGNADLIDAGILYLSQQYPNIRYAIVLNADTWLLNPFQLQEWITTMNNHKKVLAASSYVGEKSEFFRGGLASDFFIIDLKFAVDSNMFPLKYKEFEEKYWDVMLYYSADMSPILEKLLFARFSKALFSTFSCQNPADLIDSKLLRLGEREPFYHKDSDTERVWYWPEAGIVSNHELQVKKEVLIKENICEGRYIKELLYQNTHENIIR